VRTPFPPGTVLGDRYRVEGLIDAGGETFVHRALDEETGRDVAVRQYQCNDLEARQRWQRECAIKLRSKHVVEHHGGGEANGSLFVVVEYFDGRNLEVIIEEQGTFLPEEDVIHLAGQVAQGLADIHGARLVHRDVKSANVLVNASHLAKVIDLGLVRPWHGQTVANDGMARGTLHFMSPEHLTNPQAVDHCSDLYGLGVVMYQMTTGMLPFDGESPVDIQHKILHEEPLKPSVITPGLSPGLEAVILQLLAKDRSARFQSACSVVLLLGGDASSSCCPACGTPLVADGPYCSACGVNVGDAASAAALLCVETPSGPRWLVVPPAGQELGRAGLDPANPVVSARHARVFKMDGSWYVEDLGSTNGTWVDGQRVRGRSPLTRHSCLQFADVRCVFWERIS